MITWKMSTYLLTFAIYVCADAASQTKRGPDIFWPDTIKGPTVLDTIWPRSPYLNVEFVCMPFKLKSIQVKPSHCICADRNRWWLVKNSTAFDSRPAFFKYLLLTQADIFDT